MSDGKPKPTPADPVYLDEQRHLELEKLRAEIQKIRGDHHIIWRVIPSAALVGTMVLAFLTFRQTSARELREEMARNRDAEAKRWQSRQGEFEIGRSTWFPANTELAECAPGAAIAHDRTCADQKGVLCTKRENNTNFRVYRCWQPLPNGLRFSEAGSYTAAITAFDFDIGSVGDGSGSVRLRNPRIHLYIQEPSEDGFEANAQIWSDTEPHMIGVTWSALGRVPAADTR